MSDKIHVPEVAPAMCSSCFGQYPERTHVDFTASWDGPVVENGIVGENGEVATSVKVSIDELILCEDCVREAARLVGMVEPSEADEVERLRGMLRERSEELAGLRHYTEKLEAAVAVKPAKPARKAAKS